MAASTTITKRPALTPKQQHWAQLVATGLYSDLQAYVKAYKCTEKTAQSNSWRLRKDEGVMREVWRLRLKIEESLSDVLTAKSKKGRLVRIMMEGKDADAVRAIKELNAMERAEQERGGGEGSDFETLLMLIARRPRLLPHEDPDDVIDID